MNYTAIREKNLLDICYCDECFVQHIKSLGYEYQSEEFRVLGRYKFNFSIFREVCACCLHQQGLTITLRIATNSLSNIMSFFFGFSRTPLTKTSIRCNKFLLLDVSFDDKCCPFWTLFYMFCNFINIVFYMYIFQHIFYIYILSFYRIRFLYDSSNVPQFQLLSTYYLQY